MGLIQHAQSAALRIYSYIYDLLGLGALVNLVFRAVVSRAATALAASPAADGRHTGSPQTCLVSCRCGLLSWT
jgi:hypothetical protein